MALPFAVKSTLFLWALENIQTVLLRRFKRFMSLALEIFDPWTKISDVLDFILYVMPNSNSLDRKIATVSNLFDRLQMWKYPFAINPIKRHLEVWRLCEEVYGLCWNPRWELMDFLILLTYFVLLSQRLVGGVGGFRRRSTDSRPGRSKWKDGQPWWI